MHLIRRFQSKDDVVILKRSGCKMEKDIFESIDANINVVLRKKDKIIFSGSSKNCGLEIVTK